MPEDEKQLWPQGWYTDYADPNRIRFWDGGSWTNESIPRNQNPEISQKQRVKREFMRALPVVLSLNVAVVPIIGWLIAVTQGWASLPGGFFGTTMSGIDPFLYWIIDALFGGWFTVGLVLANAILALLAFALIKSAPIKTSRSNIIIGAWCVILTILLICVGQWYVWAA